MSRRKPKTIICAGCGMPEEELQDGRLFAVLPVCGSIICEPCIVEIMQSMREARLAAGSAALTFSTPVAGSA